MSQARRMARSDVLSVLLLIVLSLMVWAPRFKGSIDLRWDGSTYYLLGTSLAQGNGYRLINEPGNIQAIQYPPVLPTIVAIHQRLLGTDDYLVVGQAIRFTYCALFTFYVLASYGLARQSLGVLFALPVAVSICVLLFSIYLSDLLYTEIPFGLLTVVFAFLHRREAGLSRMFSIGAVGAVTYLLRTAGIAILTAWILDAILRRRWREAALCAALALFPVLAWQAYVRSVVTSPAYAHPAYPYQRAPYQYYNVTYAENLKLIDPFAPELGVVTPQSLAMRLLGQLPAVPSLIGESICSGGGARVRLSKEGLGSSGLSWFVLVATAGIGLSSLAGLVLLGVRRGWLIPIYLGLSLGMVLLTPWPDQFKRYLAPTAPFFALALGECLLVGSRLLERRGPERWAKYGSVGAAIVMWLIVGKSGLITARNYRLWRDERIAHLGKWSNVFERSIYYDDEWEGFNRAVDWIDAQTDASEIIASTTPQWITVRTGRKAIMMPMEADVVRAQKLLDAVPVRLLIDDRLSHADPVHRFTEGPVQAFPDLWELAYSSELGRAKVYRRRATVPPAGGAPAVGTGSAEPSSKNLAPVRGSN